MKILIVDLKKNKTKRLYVKTVMNRGSYFTIIYDNGETENYDFKTHDYFINH